MSERLFPIIGAPSIPWSLIAPCERQSRLNHGQSLERLAARGGLSAFEAMCVIRCVKPSHSPKRWSEQSAVEELAALVEAHKDVRIAALEAELRDYRDTVTMHTCCPMDARRLTQMHEVEDRASRLEAELAEARANYLRCAEAAGVVHEPESGPVVAGPVDEVVSAIRAAVLLQGEPTLAIPLVEESEPVSYREALTIRGELREARAECERLRAERDAWSATFGDMHFRTAKLGEDGLTHTGHLTGAEYVARLVAAKGRG